MSVGPHEGQPVERAGVPLGQSPVVVIMVHGRNAGPANILDLVPKIDRPELTYLAPAAAGRTWYPLSFMAETEKNEPGLSSALKMLEDLIAEVERAGVPRSRIVMLGFSQGACLTSEFAVRHASRFGGLIILTGGAIGPQGTTWNFPGDFANTPILITTGDPDSHVPVTRVNETAELFARMGASVNKRIFPGRGHYVGEREVLEARALIDQVVALTQPPGLKTPSSDIAEAGASAPAGHVVSSFGVDFQQTRVVFGEGARLNLPQELGALELQRALIVTTRGRLPVATELQSLLQDGCVGVIGDAAPHVPRPAVLTALAEVDRVNPDSVVAIGGGSAIGLAKAIALNRALPIIALPTTYAGSEMTNIYGITDGVEKHTGRDGRAAPRLVIYDPQLTLSLPATESMASGMNAIAHAVEALYAANASPVATAAAVEGLRLLARALPLLLATPEDPRVRAMALQGAHAAGVSLQLAIMGLHHKICHVLGGTFGLPHAATHAVMLPHVLEFNAPAAPDAMARITAALGATDAVHGLRALAGTLEVPTSLTMLGFRVEDIPRASDLVAASTYPNPRPVAAEDVRGILTAACRS